MKFHRNSAKVTIPLPLKHGYIYPWLANFHRKIPVISIWFHLIGIFAWRWKISQQVKVSHANLAEKLLCFKVTSLLTALHALLHYWQKTVAVKFHRNFANVTIPLSEHILFLFEWAKSNHFNLCEEKRCWPKESGLVSKLFFVESDPYTTGR